jgi:hypothetical protein
MHSIRPLGMAMLLSLSAARFTAADDPWDLLFGNAGSDDTNGSSNELVNGSIQVHDLEEHSAGTVLDQDWFRVYEQPYASYEVIVDGIAPETGDVALDRVDFMGTELQLSTEFSSFGAARSLRLRNATAAESPQFVRVEASLCGAFGACTADAKYRIQLYETTCLIPRFNNTATQVTLLIVQNGSKDAIAATARFWDAAGTLLVSQDFDLAPKGTFVLNTSSIAGGQSGSITIDHDGPYGALSGKGVAVEPATGFTFDTSMTPKLH